MDAPITPDLNVRVSQYVRLRDKIKEIKDRHKAELKPFIETQAQLNALILGLLDQAGAESVRTDSGTAYKTLDRSATLADRSAFWEYVQAEQAWHLIDYKANVTAVADFIADKAEAAKTDPLVVPAPPPGVNYSETWEVGVRRKSK